MEEKFVKGGAFLIESISPQEVFTPEEFSEEQRLIAKAAMEFTEGEVQPQVDDIEVQKEGLLPSLIKKAGELGLLTGDITEEDGGQGLDKGSVLLMMEKLSQGGGGSFLVPYAVHTGIGSLPIIPKAGAPCIGCYGPAEGALDYGSRLMTAVASVIDSNDPVEIEQILDGLPDPAGMFYRFNLAGPLLRASEQSWQGKI